MFYKCQLRLWEHFTDDNDIMILHGVILKLFSQLNFSIFTCFQCAHNVNNIFSINLDKGLEKQKGFFSFSGISSDVLSISFYVNLFKFEEIFCWIAWATFRGIVVLFSFHFNSYKINYVCKKCKKELKTSHWLKVTSGTKLYLALK